MTSSSPVRGDRGVVVRFASGLALLALSLVVVAFARVSRAIDAVERAAFVAGVADLER